MTTASPTEPFDGAGSAGRPSRCAVPQVRKEPEYGVSVPRSLVTPAFSQTHLVKSEHHSSLLVSTFWNQDPWDSLAPLQPPSPGWSTRVVYGLQSTLKSVLPGSSPTPIWSSAMLTRSAVVPS